MNLNDLHTVYFIGIGGIGMSALARYFKRIGKDVHGYDKTPSALTTALQAEGIFVHFEDAPEKLPEGLNDKDRALVVYTPAVPSEHKELNTLRSAGHRLYKRSEVLGLVSDAHRSIAVAGTHGKTTTSSMISQLLVHNEVPCNAFLGGIATDFGSNLVLHDAPEWLVTEADEFDRSFLTLHPQIGVVTSMDADHLDIYQDHNSLNDAFRSYVAQIDPAGTLVCRADLASDLPFSGKVLTYALETSADYQAKDLRVEAGHFVFDAQTPQGEMKSVKLGLPGYHNVENALATIAVGQLVGLNDVGIASALAAFKGVKRRFEYQIREEEMVYIDDYAHHPTELSATIRSVRKLYPDRKITGIFQPHLFTRTRDFADEFARSLEGLNELILLDIYPARELPIEGVTSAMLLDKVQLEQKALLTKQEIVASMADREIEVLLTLGAGDIDRLVDPIRTHLRQRLALN